jgi:hypothetical protein
MPSSALPASPNQSEFRPVYWLLCLVAAAIAARAWLLFSTPLVPGMNGAYYLVQARSLLEHGRLGIPDLPLTFWLHASLARLLQLVSGMHQDAAIVWAVKLADATLPPRQRPSLRKHCSATARPRWHRPRLLSPLSCGEPIAKNPRAGRRAALAQHARLAPRPSATSPALVRRAPPAPQRVRAPRSALACRS